MFTLLMSLGGCLALLAIIFLFIWRRTDWARIDRANRNFIDSEGNHAYYDRKIRKHR